MGDLIVVDELQQFLVAEGIGQLPAADPSTSLPSIWTQPRQGAAMPRTDNGEWLENQTVTLNDPHLSGPPGLEAWLEDAFIDITIRSRNAAEGKLLHRTIRALIHPIGELAGKRNWIMNELRVLYSSIWRNEQPLPPVDGGITYDRVASYRFTCARSDLAA